jgi:phosphoglycerate kinase
MNSVGKKLLSKRTIRKVPLKHKVVLVRVDYNVPLHSGKVSDDFRIRASLPTIRRLLKDNCKVVLISHLGRPDGKRDASLSLRPPAQHLAELLQKQVRFVDQSIGAKVKMAVKRAPMGSVTVLENLRFHPEEEANDADFAKRLVSDTGAQYFVQDGFGVVHRAHASTDAITNLLPSVAGLLLEKEYEQIVGAMQRPRRPLIALLGGAKVSDKIQVIEKLVRVADQIVVGGALANTFLAYVGHPIGASKFEPGQEEVVRMIYDAVDKKVSPKFRDNFLVLPTDVAVAKTADETAQRVSKRVDKLAGDDIILDIGENSIERMSAAINRAQTVIWNGTMGMAELPNFAHGSARAALELAKHSKACSIIGGGDTADFVLHWDAREGNSFTHVSTGGGASLELMAGKKLPGIEALLDA